MVDDHKKDGYGITVFRPGTPPEVKKREFIFFVLLCIIIMVQALYWLFANSVQPLVWGMPFGLFFIILFIMIEFIVLLILYFLEAKDTAMEEGGRD